MDLTVSELAKLTGVTVRTLHHYDEIGLLCPSKRTRAGYRLYGDSEVERLQQILLFRELGLGLDAIRDALDSASSLEALLNQHHEVLLTKRAKLDAMIAAVEVRLRRGRKAIMTNDEIKAMFSGFDPEKYEVEAKARWGNTDAYKESARRTKGYTKEDWERYREEAKRVDDALVALMRANVPVTAPEVQQQVLEHRLLIDRWFYPCGTEMHKDLGAMYVADERFKANLDRHAPGYAKYLSDAIAAS